MFSDEFKKVVGDASFFKDYHYCDEPTFETALMDAGWRWLASSGSQETQIYRHPKYPRVVARISTKQNIGFMEYLTLCQKYKGNPYFQKVYESFEYPNGVHVSFLERLLPFSRRSGSIKTDRKKPYFDFYTFLYEGYKDPELVEKHMADEHLKQALRAIFNKIDDSLLCENGLGLDIGGDNLMARVLENGSLFPVISDPLEGSIRKEDRELYDYARYPWVLALRRKLGLLEPNHMKPFPDFKDNSWVYQ